MIDSRVGLDSVELTLRLRGVAAALSAREVAAAAVQTVRWAIDTDVSWCGLIDIDALIMVAHQGMRNPDIAEMWRLPLGQGIGGRVAVDGRPLVVRDYARDPRRVPVLKELIDAEELRSSICAAIGTDEQIFGVLYVSERSVRTFDQAEIDLVSAIASLTGAVLADRWSAADHKRSLAEASDDAADQRRLMSVLLDLAEIGASHPSPPQGVAGGVRALARALSAEVRLLDEHGNLQVSAGDVDGDELASVALLAGSTTVGGLVVKTTAPLTIVENELLRAAGHVVALLVMRQRIGAETELRLTSEFIDELLSGAASTDEPAFVGRAAMLGLDLFRPATVLCLGKLAADEFATGVLSRREREVIERVANRLVEHAVTCHRPTEVVVIASTSDDQPIGESLKSLIAALSDELPGVALCAGVGRSCARLAEYSASYSEASMCLRLAIVRGVGSQILSPADLGLYALFGHVETRTTLSAVVAQTLGALLDADERAHSDYLRTLTAFFVNDRHLENTSRALHVHVNTLRYRLSKIQSITGIDLRDVDGRFVLELALRAHQAFGG